jgi:hypothetical protein
LLLRTQEVIACQAASATASLREVLKAGPLCRQRIRDLEINYHPGKANVVADALSRTKYCNATFAKRMQPELRREIKYLNMEMVNEAKVTMEVELTLEVEI